MTLNEILKLTTLWATRPWEGFHHFCQERQILWIIVHFPAQKASSEKGSTLKKKKKKKKKKEKKKKRKEFSPLSFWVNLISDWKEEASGLPSG